MNSRNLFLRLLVILLVANSSFAQVTYTFTNAGAVGAVGPSALQISTAYGPTNLSGSVTVLGGIQSFTIPVTGTYSITAFGARGTSGGAFTGGSGARMSGTFSLTAGSVIRIAVGQMGLSDGCSGGGGGGSFVVDALNAPLIIAAGGGGIRTASSQNGCPGGITTFGGFASGSSPVNACTVKTSGAGFGGIVSSSSYGAGGGGFNGAGSSDFSTGGGSWATGVPGGGGGAAGGFGGGGSGNGGCGGGGGGGYSGGDGGHVAGGGGSFNSGTSQSNAPGANGGQGYVLLTRLAGVNVVQSSSIMCNGQLTGVLTASASGGTSPYTYLWSPGGSTSATLSGVGAGTYTCVATDAASVAYTTTYTITQPPVLFSILTQTNVSCNGTSTGILNVTVAGGVTPYTYSWSPTGGTGSTASNLPAGTYTCVVRDANLCLSMQTATITQPPPISVLGFATSPVVCLGQSSNLIGAGALTYTWSHGVTNGVPFVPSVTTTYTVNGTNAAGCTGSALTTITVNPLPSLSISGPSVICSGNTATLTVSGADTYTWSTASNATVITDVPAATTIYTVVGANLLGCQNSASKTVTVINTNPTVTANASNSVVCFGNTTTLFGGGAVTYVWTGGVSNNVAFSPTSTDSYTVTGSNACGSATAVTTVTVNTLPIITANASSTAICNTNSVSLFGGGGLTYTWTGGVSNNVAFFPSTTTVYSVSGTDANGCVNTANQTIVVNPIPVVTANVSNSIVCFGSTVIFTGGGALAYIWTSGVTNGVSYFPTATASYTVLGIDLAGCQNTAAITVTVSTVPTVSANATNSIVCSGSLTTLFGSGALTYVWTGGVTDNVPFVPPVTTIYTVTGTNLCGSNTATIGIAVNAAPSVTANASSTAVCIGSPVTLSGAGAVTYTWSNGVTDNTPFFPTVTQTYTVTGSSAIGCQNSATRTIVINTLPVVTASVTNTVVCNGTSVVFNGGGALSYIWTNGVTNGVAYVPFITNTYTVTGTDVNGCQNTALKTVTVQQLPVVMANASATMICFGNSAILYGGGANTYTWSGGMTNGSVFFPTATTGYTVTGTNTLTGCTSTNNAVVTITVNPLPVITATATPPSVCLGQQTSLNAGGATTYTWTGGVVNGVPFAPATTTNYFVTGTNLSTGCSNLAMLTVTVNPIPTVTANATSTTVCAGFTTALSGSGAHTYTWTGGVVNAVPYAPSVTSTHAVSGTNTLTGCTSTNVAQITVTVNALPNLQLTVTNTNICEGNSAILFATGASTYSWTNGVINGVSFFPISTTTYVLLGTNLPSGCTSTISQAIVVNPAPVVTANSSGSLVCHGSSVTLTGSGANTYIWSGGVVNGAAFVPATTSTYSLSGTNTLTGCSSTVMAVQTISVIALPIVGANSTSSTVCNGSTVSLTGSGADTYTWSGGVINGVPFTPASTITYSVNGTSTLTGCTSTNTAVQTITVVAPPVLNVITSVSVICVGETLSLTATGANTYTWNTGGQGSSIAVTPGLTSSYTVTGTSAATGCSNTAVVTPSVSDCTGISSNQETETGLSIYPNPNNGEFSIISGSDLKINLINELGQVVKSITLDADNEHQIRITDLANGIYFIRGEQGHNLIHQKIIVAK